MSKRSHKALASATVMSLILTSTLTATNVQAASSVERLGGGNREATATSVAKSAFPNGTDTVVLVNGYDGYGDSVSATPLAKALNAPILLTDDINTPSADLIANLKDLKAKKIVIVGGEGVVPKALADKLASSYKVERIGGNNRYETNANVAKKVLELTGEKGAFLVNGQDGYADALSVASIAATKGMPILFANKNEVPAEVKEAAKGLTISAVGGKTILPDAVVTSVGATRVAGGGDRFETNIEVLNKYKDVLNFDNMYMAYGGYDKDDFADALVASAAAAKTGAPVVLSGKKDAAEATTNAKEYLENNLKDSKVYLVGGEAALEKAIEDSVKNIVNPVATDLKVESVSAIDKTKVDVKITALTEALTDVTVTVKDNNGNVVEVKPVAVLDVGETVATFTFKTALTANPAGEWTVNGVKFDADAQAAVKAVKDAGNQVELLNALKSSYFTSANADLIAKYDAEDFSNVVTVEDVQKIIDKVNKAEAGLDAAKAVREATNEVELLAALQDGGFERVNVDLITGYATYDGNADSTADYTVAATPAAVQAIVDAVNLKAAQDAVTAADTTATTALKADSIAKAQELVSALPEKEDAEKTTKKGLQDRIDVANAYAKVKGATTQVSLLSALKAPVLKLQNIDDALAKYYKQVFDADKDNIADVTYDLQSDIVDAGKTAAITDYATKISKIDDKTALTDVKALLTELKRLDGTTFTEKINDALLEDYRDALVAETTVGNKNTTTEINTIVQNVNKNDTELGKVAAFDENTKTADDLLVLLKDKKLALKNVVDTNKDAYFADVTLIKTEATTPKTVADLQKAINTINFVADANAATTAAEMQTALTGTAVNEGISDYVKLSSAAKAEVAELVLAARAEETGKVFADLAAVKGAITAQTTAYTTFLGNVNAATDIDDMMSKLDDAAFPAYQELGTVEKVEKAELVFNELNRLKALDPVEKFETIAEIKAAANL